MGRQIISLIIFVVLIIILVGAGVLLYRFLTSYGSSTVAVLTINDDAKFTAYQLNLENDKPFRIKNDDDQKQVIKKQEDNSTFVEVEAHSTSRELTTDDNSRIKLYIASNPNQVATIITGNANAGNQDDSTESTDNTENKDSSGAVQATTDQASQPLPNTGPENFLYAPIAALIGIVLYRFSAKILRG